MPRIELCGSSVEYREQGSGEPLVLLHSTGASSSQWRALIERLSPRFRVIAPDLCGYGGTSPWTGRGAFCLGHEAAVVGALLERLDEPVHLVGHSYGGAVALRLARLRGELIRSLAVIEPVAFHLLRCGDDADASALQEITRIADAVARALACGDYNDGFRQFVEYWSGPGTWAGLSAAKREGLAARLSKVALDFHATLNEPARLEDFRTMTAPALLIRGERSTVPAQRIGRLLARALPGLCTKTIDGAGHMAPLTHPDEINEALVAHIAAHAGVPA
jgi:pimeloyl-ACP methyl ester carboxylesterase